MVCNTISNSRQDLSKELRRVLDHYWATAELPESLSDEELDLLIAKAEQAARKENEMKRSRRRLKRWVTILVINNMIK